MSSAVNVNISVYVEDAEDNSVRSQALGESGVAPHDFELVCFVTEVAAPRADHDVQSGRNCGPRRFNEAGTGSDSALHQATAQFQTRGSASLRRPGGRDRINADFNQNAGSAASHASSAFVV